MHVGHRVHARTAGWSGLVEALRQLIWTEAFFSGGESTELGRVQNALVRGDATIGAVAFAVFSHIVNEDDLRDSSAGCDVAIAFDDGAHAW